MKTLLPNAREFPRFAGIPTFCRYPLLDSLDHAPDWALYGVPFDAGVTYRPGARFGPRAIRVASAYVKPYHLEHDLNLAEVFSLADAGDSPISPYSTEKTQHATARFASGLGDRRTRLFAVGGDHSIALANLRAVRKRHSPKKPLALIHFDAHLDTVDVISGEKYTHASPFIRAVEEGLIDPKAMMTIGIRGPLNTATDLDYARQHGITILTMRDVASGRATAALAEFVAELRRSGRPTYLTFDIDSIDPAFAPATGTPSVGGLTTHQSLEFLRACRGVNLVGADLVEVLPDLDHAGTTAFLAAHLIFEILCASAPL